MRYDFFRVHSDDCRFGMNKNFKAYRKQSIQHKDKLKLVFDYRNIIAKNNKTKEDLRDDQFAYLFCKEWLCLKKTKIIMKPNTQKKILIVCVLLCFV